MLHALVNNYRPYTTLPRHGHDGASLSLVLDGHYVERMGRRTRECAPLSLLYKTPGIEHSNHIGARGLRALFVEIPAEAADSLVAESPQLREIRCVRLADESPLVRRLSRYVGQDGRATAAAHDELLHLLLLDVLGRDARRLGRRQDAWLAHVRDFVHAHYDQRVSLTEAAGVGGVHPVHLAQTFRHVLGCTFRQYLQRVRLDAARAALADRAQTITAIATAAGFADHAHFSRTFRAHFGATPTEYRRSLP